MGTNYNAEHIASLVVQEISGTISPKDKLYLHQTIQECEEAYSLWHKTHAELDSLTIRKNLALLKQDDPSLSLGIFFKKKIRSRWIAFIAILLVKSTILLTAGYFLSKKNVLGLEKSHERATLPTDQSKFFADLNTPNCYRVFPPIF